MEERLKSEEQEVKFHPIVVETDSDSEISKDNNLPVIRSEQDNIFDLAKQEPSKNESVVSTESIHEIPIFGITPEITQEYKERLEKMRRWGYVLPRLLGFKDKNYRLNYTDNTNYLDALPYEACCAGPRYWQLITNLLEKHEVLKDEEPTVLEFGSATGNLLEILSDKYQTAHLFGVDIVEEASKKAKTKVPNATIIVGDLNNPEVVDCVFGLEKLQKVDLIIAMDVIEHMDSKEKQLVLVKNIFEALKPGGWAIIGMPERPSKSDGVVKRIFKTLWNMYDKDTSHFNKPTPEEFDKLIEDGGFQKDHIVADFPYFPIPAPLGGLTDKFPFSANRLIMVSKEKDQN